MIPDLYAYIKAPGTRADQPIDHDGRNYVRRLPIHYYVGEEATH